MPPLLAVALLSLAMPAREALNCTLGGFRWVFSAEITSLPFYRESMGLLQPLAQVRTLLEFLLWYVALGDPGRFRICLAATAFRANDCCRWHFRRDRCWPVLAIHDVPHRRRRATAACVRVDSAYLARAYCGGDRPIRSNVPGSSCRFLYCYSH